MKLRSLLLLGATAALVPVGGFVLTQSVVHTAALAQSSAPVEQTTPKPERSNRGGANKWQQLNLSADQRTQIQKIREQEKTSSESLRQQLRAAAEKQRSLMEGSASDDQLRQQYRETQALRQQMETRRFETMLQIRAVLTPEQRAKAAQFKKEHRGFHRGGPEGKQARGMEMMPDPAF